MADEYAVETNDKAKILNGGGDVVHEVRRPEVREKKKRKKVKRSKSHEHLPSSNAHYSYNEQPRHVQLALEPMGSREKVIQIHEELNNINPHSRTEINREEKDLRKLALQLAISKSNETKNNKFLHHDYVLVHRTGDNRNLHEKLRKKYESELHAQGFRVDRKYTAEKTFVVLHCSFERLCEEAEHVSLEMPLAGVSLLVILILIQGHRFPITQDFYI